jgi:hypothetical protein
VKARRRRALGLVPHARKPHGPPGPRAP